MFGAVCESGTKEIFWTNSEIFFQSENFADRRFIRLQSSFNDPLTEVYLLFYQAVLPCFTNFNKLLQREEPLIYKLYDS